jgi:tetratricopeptide (TPR) repeat protein
LGQHQRAIEDYDKAIHLDPEFIDAYINRGLAYVGLCHHQQAKEDYDKAISLDPNSTGAYNNRGLVYMKLGQYQQAIEDYDKAISLDPEYSFLYYNLGCLHSLQKNLSKALKYLELALKNGYNDFDWIKKDNDLDNIRFSKEFDMLINKHKK